MKRLLPMLAVFLTSCLLYADEKGQSVPLFDGTSFAGWEGNEKIFRIQDGAIVGGTFEEKIAHNDFLCTTKQYKDFELSLKFKLVGKGVNAGVQIRSKRIPNHHEVIGYQADLGDGYWGAIYDESRRNKILAAPKPEDVQKVLRREDWNEYVIRCEGPRIRIWLNGLQTVDYTEPDENIAREGVIGLQIHGGPPSLAMYKDLSIKEL